MTTRSPLRTAGHVGRRGALGRAGCRQRRQRGMTMLEIMIALAVIGGVMYVGLTGLRSLTSADIAGTATDLAALMRRASQKAVETGEMHRLLVDLDQQVYTVEVCQGTQALVRKQKDKEENPKKAAEAIKKGEERLGQLPAMAASAAGAAPSDPEAAAKRAAALAGHHVADRLCGPAFEDHRSRKDPVPMVRKLGKDSAIKVREVWVAHLDDSVTTGTVAVYFFSNGSSEKAIINLSDGDGIFSLLIYGLTGKIEVLSTPLASPDDHMMRNALGDREDDDE